MRRWRCSVAVVLFVVVLFAVQHWLVWNTTPSLPRGLYRKTWQEPQQGDTVLVCPPDLPVFRLALERRFLSPGLCPSGIGQLIKTVAGMGGDLVRVDQDGVTVNGHLLLGSARQNFGLGQVADWEARLAAGKILLMTPHPKSFDARYFGPLDQNTIITPLQPVWVKE